MGGNAIKSAERIDKNTFETYALEILKLFPELKMEIVKSFHQKQNFGDMDIVVQKESFNIKELIKKRLNPKEEFDNGPYFSVLYKNAQVDFIFHSKEDFESACNYYAYNDISNFFGRVARSLNFKYGTDGLSYEKHLDDHYKISTIVSNDVQKCLEFLGYDYHIWKKGFDTENDIFKFTISSPYFNSLYFSLDEQNHNDKVRNRKRKMYQKMLEYIKLHEIKPKQKLTQIERLKHYQRAIKIFGNHFDLFVKEKEIDYQNHLIYKEKFNGDIVKTLVGLDGKELGGFMQRMQSAIPDFKNLIIKSNCDEIQNLIKNFSLRTDMV